MTKTTIKSELKRRNDLIFNEDFRKKAIEVAKELGITAREWNENKPTILMYIANMYCSMENDLGLEKTFKGL